MIATSDLSHVTNPYFRKYRHWYGCDTLIFPTLELYTLICRICKFMHQTSCLTLSLINGLARLNIHLPDGSVVKNPPANAGDVSSIPGLGRSPGEGNGNPLQQRSPAGYSPFFSSVQFSRSVVSDSLRLHESQHARPPCPSPTRGVHSDTHASSRWCHPAISFSVVPFSSFPQSLPASGSFPMSQLFAWGGQSTGVSALASFLPKNTQDWSPLGWTGWISLQSKDSQESSPTPQFKSVNSLVLSFLHSPILTSIHDHWKNNSFD